MNEKLLTVDEVAQILRTTPNTIYRWLRAGKLPGIKLGKEWRIKKETLELKLHETNQLNQLRRSFLDNIDPHHDHVLAVTNSKDNLYNLEAEFFKKGLAKGYRLFKGCWWQHPDDVRQELTQRGLPIEDLEAKNSLVIVDLIAQYNRSGKNGPIQIWANEIEKTVRLGYPTMWGSGSPHLLSCGGRFSNLVEFERSLEDILKKLPAAVICPYIFEDIRSDCFGQLIELMKHHNSVLFYNDKSATLLKNYPV